MSNINIVAVFCDDVREERAGTETLVGVYPSSVQLAAIPSGLPKCAVYCRFHFSTEEPDFSARVAVETSWGQVFELGEIDTGLIQRSKRESLEQGFSTSAVISRAIFAPFPVQQEGYAQIIVTIQDEKRICGAVRFLIIPSSASKQPSSQSPPAEPAS